MTQQLSHDLKNLRLSGMAQALEQQLEQQGTYEGLGFLERLQLLVEHEQLTREQRKQERLIKQARFKLRAQLKDLDYRASRNLDRQVVADLATNQWLHRYQNLLVTGPCGSGKTYLACALGYQACLQGYSSRYYRISRLMIDLTQAKADGSYRQFLKQLAKTELLILDDWGLEALEPAQRHDLLEVMDDRHGQSSTLVISQLPTDQWYASIGDSTLADAILDRLMHNAHRINLRGESMRKRQAELTHREHLS